MKKRRKLKKGVKRIIRVLLFLIVLFLLWLIPNEIYKNTFDKIIQKESSITEKSVFPNSIDEIPVYTSLISLENIARPGTKRKIKYIVIHETDNEGESANAKSHANYLLNNNNEKKSWHYTVDENEIYHHLPDNEIAYHAGDYNGNMYGVGIELCVNDGSDFNKTMDNAAKLVAYLIKEYDLSINDVKTHHDFSGKDCPHKILENKMFSKFIKKVRGYL